MIVVVAKPQTVSVSSWNGTLIFGHKEHQMSPENNLTPKVTVVVSTPDVGQAPMPEAAPARVTRRILRIGRDKHNFARLGNVR